MRDRRILVVAALLAVVLAAGCGSPGDGGPAPPVALAPPTAAAEQPIRDAQLTPGQRYRFTDVLPGLLDVELTAPDPPLYNASDPTITYLSPDADFRTDALVIMAAWMLRVPRDPYFSPAGVATAADEFTLTTLPPIDTLLPYFARLPFVEVTAPEQPVAVGGVEGRAVELRIRDLPPEAARCGSYFQVPRCANTLLMPGAGFMVEPGAALRLVDLRLPSGTVLVQQNLTVPAAQAALDDLAFVERPAPPEFGGARLVPFGGLLDPGQEYVNPELADGVAVTFRAPSEQVRAIAGPGWLGIVNPDRRPLTLVAPLDDLRIPEPGVDPLVVDQAALDRSAPLPPEGLIDWVVAQPWAEVVVPPADAPVGGLPGRAALVRARPGAPTLACDPYEPSAGSCATFVFGGTSGGTIRIRPDEVLQLSEVTAAGRRLAVLDRGADATGGTLRFVARGS